MRAHGIGTIADLRNDHEVAALPGNEPRPASRAVHVPLDDLADTEFWEHCWSNDLDGSPLYYQLFLDRKAERCAAALAAVARAGPGGVVLHCGSGRDRTGLISLLLLALVGVESEDIVSDYQLSNVRLRAHWTARGEPDESREIEEILARKNTSARALLLDVLSSLDADAYLRTAGLGDADIAAIRSRLLGARES